MTAGPTNGCRWSFRRSVGVLFLLAIGFLLGAGVTVLRSQVARQCSASSESPCHAVAKKEGESGSPRTNAIPSTPIADQAFNPRMSKDEKDAMLRSVESLDTALKRANVTYFLYSGTLLGAHRHRGMIPWDDDFDIMVNYTQLREMESALRSLTDFELYTGNVNRYKLHPKKASAVRGKAWKWPYVDICFFSENATHVYDKYPSLQRTHIYAKIDVFPLVYRPFEHLLLPSPADEVRVVARNYDAQTCVTSCYSHKLEAAWRCSQQKSVPCSQLYTTHSFIFRNSSFPPIKEVLMIANKTLKEFLLY